MTKVVVVVRAILKIKGFTNDINKLISTIDMDKMVWDCEKLIPLEAQEEDEIEMWKKWGCLTKPRVLSLQHIDGKTKNIKTILLKISCKTDKYPKPLIEYIIHKYPMFVDIIFGSRQMIVCGIDRYENGDYYLQETIVHGHYREEICRRLWDESRENYSQTNLNFDQ